MMDDMLEAELTMLDQKLIRVSGHQASVDLFSGKMGYCLYFYKMANISGHPQYEKTADILLDNVCQHLKNFRLWDIEKGLSGIALGIHYLIKERLIKGNINEILRDFDTLLFKLILFPDKKQPVDFWLKVQLLYYYSIRIADQKKESGEEFIIRGLIFKILHSFTQFPDELFEEPYLFSLEYRLPFFLHTLGVVSDIDIFRDKVRKMADEITFSLTSRIPVLHSHRIYLVWGMLPMAEKLHLETWKKHIQLLRRETDIRYMFASEFRNRNIFLKNGLTGMVCLLKEYNKMAERKEKISYDPRYIRERIIVSKSWKQLKEDEHFFKNNSGLNGFCGVSLLMNTWL